MTDRYAVFGNPARHSKSPLIHAAYALATGQDLTYEVIEPPVDGFAAAVHAFRADGGRGGNVTMPFKLDAFALATDRSERARLAGAVNCMKFEGDRIHAENFDGVGLVNDIQAQPRLRRFAAAACCCWAPAARRAARCCPSSSRSRALLVIANRTVAKAKALGEQFATLRQSRHRRLCRLRGSRIRSSSSTRRPRACAASCRRCTRAAFAPGCLAYDLVYGKGLTPFLRLARDAGAGRHRRRHRHAGRAGRRGVRMVARRAARDSALIEKLSVPLV